MTEKLIALPYEYDSLEPYIDSKTMEIHHLKHHNGYVDKFNATVKGTALENTSVEEILSNVNNVPEEIRQKVINFGGGVYNHNFFFSILKKDTSLLGEILEAIEKKFGSFEKFKEEFLKSATTLFGSGWTWLVKNKEGELEIFQTKNQDTPISDGLLPLICADVWEHAYYLKYQNRRAEYLEGFFKVINWEKVNGLFLNKKE